MITLDTSAVIALLNREDREHDSVTSTLLADAGPYLVPGEALGEIGHFVESRFGPTALDEFLADLEAGHYSLDCTIERVSRTRGLVARYADLPLGFVDAAVIACAERNGGRVLTLDRRHFGVVAREGTISPLPEVRS